MPKSKRQKVIHTSKTEKKGKELTLRLFANVQDACNKYPYIYVFSVENMRNTYLKNVRTQLSDSRLFFGKTKVMAVALGLTPSTAPLPGTSLLTPHLRGPSGLLFSPNPPSFILSHFEAYRPLDYARAGTLATRSFTLPPGVLHSRGGEIPEEEDVPLAHSIEPTLRKLGVPTRLVKGRVELEGEYVVCREGEVLGSGQTTLLKMFGVVIAEFAVEIRAYWTGETGEVVVVGESSKGAEDMANGGEAGEIEDGGMEVEVDVEA